MKSAQFRIAFRGEGSFWNAYLTALGTMNESVLLGSILMNVVRENIEIKNRFMGMMQDTISFVGKEVGVDLLWPDPPYEASEHERSGNA